MRFDIITLFPELFTPFLTTGVTRRAFKIQTPANSLEKSTFKDENTVFLGNLEEKALQNVQNKPNNLEIHLHALRDFASGNYRRIDDRPFGGGPGMVMLIEPLVRCLEHIWLDRGLNIDFLNNSVNNTTPIIAFSPVGDVLKQSTIEKWSKNACNLPQSTPHAMQKMQTTGAILVCARYEGLDQRFIDHYVTEQISLGDFVLSGGEIAAIAFLDAIARLQEGVLHDAQSHLQDSFSSGLQGLLDHPHYTRPETWQKNSVPSVLLNGNHSAIAAWRRAQSLKLTYQKRPDLIEKARQKGFLSTSDEQFLQQILQTDDN